MRTGNQGLHHAVRPNAGRPYNGDMAFRHAAKPIVSCVTSKMQSQNLVAGCMGMERTGGQSVLYLGLGHHLQNGFSIWIKAGGRLIRHQDGSGTGKAMRGDCLGQYMSAGCDDAVRAPSIRLIEASCLRASSAQSHGHPPVHFKSGDKILNNKSV
jgi:hypothetical protein